MATDGIGLNLNSLKTLRKELHKATYKNEHNLKSDMAKFKTEVEAMYSSNAFKGGKSALEVYKGFDELYTSLKNIKKQIDDHINDIKALEDVLSSL